MRARQIKQLHQMARDGMPASTIARELGIHRNTVTEHLALRVSYPYRLISELGLRRTLPVGDPLPLRDAAVYLPGWPSRIILHTMHRDGVLDGTKTSRGIMVSLAAIREASRKLLPDGLWFRSSSIQHYASLQVQMICEAFAVKPTYRPSKNFGWVPAYRVHQIARDYGLHIDLTADAVHRIVATLDLCSVATIG